MSHTDEVYFFDPLGYWEDVAMRFSVRTGHTQVLFANGSYPTSTAGNQYGFSLRRNGGKNAADNMIEKIEKGLITLGKTEPVDIVCHSFGFAYAMGMLEQLHAKGYKIGRVYCIAAENPSEGNVPDFVEEMWQYGSDEVNDPLISQDLIAPQKPINGINLNRLFIPNSVPKNWIESHLIANYMWIFDKQKGQKGYVEKR